MRYYETQVQSLKDQVLTSVAKLAWEDQLDSPALLKIPEQVIPGPEAQMRCCIYKERAIVNQRVQMAMGGNEEISSVVEVLPVACDECPVSQISVGESCRGCIAHRCKEVCPKGAISIVNHRSVIDHDKCILCGKCVSACPYNAIVKNVRPCERACPVDAISMGEDRKANINYDKCISCGECVIQCPFGAIMDKSYITHAIQMLKNAEKEGYHVYAALAPSFVGQFEGTIGQMVTALKKLGFYSVEEVALGADMTAEAEAVEFEEKQLMTSSCCPAFVNFVEKHMPQQAHLVSHTPSPMVMLGLHLKQKDPKAKVIFFGPCVAKKMEFQLEKTKGAIDLSLSFEELYAMITGKGLRLTEQEEAVLDEASGFGRGFANSGGVAAAVAQALKEKGSEVEARTLPCSGIAECRMNILKMSKGLIPQNFIEGMACSGGCSQGPVGILRSPKNKTEVAKHVKEAGDRTSSDALTEARK